MKKSLTLAMALALGVTASAYAANPFSDVPQGHWAYASVAQLAADGVIDGYADGAFAGDKLLTRYEMAQIVAKAMANGANVDKLAAEFADELDTLGVRVTKLESKADAVKITGEVRYHYADKDVERVVVNHPVHGNEFAGNKFEFKTYEVEVALFEEDFHKPPVIHSIRVRLKDEEYLLLLQWQLQNPDCGFNHYDVDSDASFEIQNKVEEVFFPDGNVGTYAVFLK